MGSTSNVPATDTDTWDLLSLTPKYIEDEHGRYVAAISKAFTNPRIKNIALSGNYGVGKSSILQKVAELEPKRVVELSLSTLAPIEVTDVDEHVPVQATTPTNRIQQEIVKQLLYREKPEKATGSRFRRIERFHKGRELLLSAIVGLVATMVFLLAGWGETIVETLDPLIELHLWIYPILFGLTTVAVFALRALLHGRVHIKAFSAGPAAVTLDEHSVSYFDQYLDEIVYFFETSDYDIVIFEDIDRFNNSHIFETLRSLNTLLNAAPQIKNRPIRFVYAIKDSIFDRIGLESEGRQDATLADIKDPAAAEAVRANRTKFFDLVIPVVPFITHRSARNLASKLLEGVDNEVSPDLIDLAGRFVPDMRLLKNVRNEFIVFRDRIFSGDGSALELSETDLFAMMLYKSTHLSDFEAIRLGSSKLDKLYAASRELVAANIARLERERRATRQSIARTKTLPTRAAQMGDRLIAHVERTARAARFHLQSQQYTLQNSTRTVDQLKSAAFWKELAEAPDGTTVGWRNNYGHSLSFTRTDIVDALDDSLDVERWSEADQERLNDLLEEQREQLAFLRSADMGALMKRPEFHVEFEGSAQSLESVAEHLLTRGLAFSLVRAEYINRNFTLYTSTFHGDRVSSAATNFIIHHVERDEMDVHFQLEADDVAAVIRERGASALSEPALFNISILDHLLEHGDDSADIMIAAIAGLGERAREFLQAYLTASSQLSAFLPRFVRRCTRALDYLVTQAELDDATRLGLVSDTLANLATGAKYFTDAATTRYLLEHYRELPVLISDKLDSEAAARIRIVYGMAGLKLPDLTPLTPTIRDSFVARNLYDITRENLEAALGDDVSLALDSIRSSSDAVYGYVMENLGSYLEAVDGHTKTNDSADTFTVTIEDVLKHDADRLDDVIQKASEASRVIDLGDVPEAAWPVLARSIRFPATFNNVTRYIALAGSVDEDLASVLKLDGRIADADSASEEEKVALAAAILASRPHLHSTVRVPLVVSLELDEFLETSAIQAENGPLFALLVENNLIADESDTYEHIENIDWQWREQFIAASSAFKNYMTPELVGDDLGNLLSSGNISKPIKLAVLDDASEYSQATDAAGRRELARFALASKRKLPLDVVEALPGARTNAATVIELLTPHLGEIDDVRLFALLNALGAPYSQLTYVGRDHPKVSNTTFDQALLRSLEARGIVSTWDPRERPIVVNKKHKS